MSTSTDAHTRRGMARQLGEFLTKNLHKRDLGWPKRGRSGPRKVRAAAANGSLAGMRVLVVGDLTLELPLDVAATRPQLIGALRSGTTADKLRWTPSEPEVGGFVAHASRAAAALGASVLACTTIPVPTPARFERFFDDHGIDRRWLTAVPGPCPINIRFRCYDGQVVTRARRLQSAGASDLPDAAAKGFDVILIDTAHSIEGSSIPGVASPGLDRVADRLTIAFRLGRRLAGDELAVARQSRVWSFIRLQDARHLVRQAGAQASTDPDTLVRCLRDRYGIAKLVLQRGSRGAVLMNGIPCPYRVQTCPLAPAAVGGAGDTLLAVTALSSASGADDRTSIRRGVAAATGVVAGLSLPSSLEELDAA